MWSREVRSLGVEVVAPTLYGFGDTIEAWAAGALDACGDGPLVVVGNSVGGSCALELAVLAGDRVRGLVLLGTKAGVRPEPDFRDEAVRVMRDEGLDAAWARYWSPIFGPSCDPAIVERARLLMHAVGVEDVVRGTCVFHDRPDRQAFLDGFDGVVVRASGEHDRIPKDRDGLVEIPDCGHYVPLERPDAVTDLVRGVLAQV